MNALEQDKKQLKKANEALSEKAKKLEEELTFVRYEEMLLTAISVQLIQANVFLCRELNKSLLENQKQWKERVRTLEDQNVRVDRETALRIGDLEGQVGIIVDRFLPMQPYYTNR